MLIEDKPTISNVEQNGKFLKIETPHMRCTGCLTSYPVIDGKVMWNGKEIIDCPYCIHIEGVAAEDDELYDYEMEGDDLI